jgi:hypothetical protein
VCVPSNTVLMLAHVSKFDLSMGIQNRRVRLTGKARQLVAWCIGYNFSRW